MGVISTVRLLQPSICDISKNGTWFLSAFLVDKEFDKSVEYRTSPYTDCYTVRVYTVVLLRVDSRVPHWSIVLGGRLLYVASKCLNLN